MKKRIITGLVMACVMIPLIFLTANPVFYMFFTIIAGFSGYELIKCTGLLKNYAIAVPVELFTVLLTLFCGIVGNNVITEYSAVAVSVLLLWAASVYVVMAAKDDGKEKAGHSVLSGICITVFFAMYIAFGFSFFVIMAKEGTDGLFTAIMVFVISYVTDICAYFSGMFFGKHKLIPKVSPKKTVEGAVGGTLMSTVLTVLYGFIVHLCNSSVYVSIPGLLIVGLLGSVVSQFGDLLMSALKRSYGIKDFGWILPGHGGILDRFDSVLAVSIITYAGSRLFSIFSL